MEKSNQHIDSLVRLRKELHKHPEVSGTEIQTAKRVLSFLENYPPDELITRIGTTGIIAIYKGTKSGKTVLFRCELDALPIEESNTYKHRSVINGVSHKCGHDGHMAILCGLAAELHHNKPESGTVFCYFSRLKKTAVVLKKYCWIPNLLCCNPITYLRCTIYQDFLYIKL